MLQNPRKFKNSPNLLALFAKITKFLEFSKKITIKTIVFYELWTECHAGPHHVTAATTGTPGGLTLTAP